jgi:hypothetical protein
MIKQIIFQTKIRLVRAIDDLITSIQRLRIRNYIYTLRIEKVIGRLINCSENDALVIFIVFEKTKVPQKTIETLQYFKNAGLQLLVINNGNPKNERQLIEAGSDVVITRNNTGKDFGGYKDATLYLHRNKLLKWKKIIYANDSVVYPSRIIAKLTEHLLEDNYDFIAHSQVKEIHFHFQSFLFSCSNSLFQNEEFTKFWESYVPIDRRRYMIKNGEVGLTKKILKTGCSINVINTYENIQKQIVDFEEVNEFLNELPDRYRSQKKIFDIQSKMTETLIELQSLKTSRIFDDQIKESVINITRIKDQSIKAYYLNIAQEIFREISIGNPSHLGFSFFSKNNYPFVIKRDLSYRAGYDYDFVIYLLRKYYPEENKQIAMMMKKPSGNHYKGLKLFMFNQGMI